MLNVVKKPLSAALDILAEVIPTRSSNPLLTHVLLEIGDGEIRLTGSNLDVDARVRVPAEVAFGDHEPLLVPAHLFAEIVNRLPGNFIEFERHSRGLKLRSQGAAFDLQPQDRDAYPELDFRPGPGEALELDAADLRATIGAVRYAVGKDAVQSVFRCIDLTAGHDGLEVVACDGFRLAWRNRAGEYASLSALLPPPAVGVLQKVLKTGAVSLSRREAVLVVHGPGVALNLKLVDGAFPDWRGLVPRGDEVAAFTVDAGALREAVARVAILADAQENRRLDLMACEGRLELHAQESHGSAREVMAVHDATGVVSCSVNAAYFQDALAGRAGDVRLSVHDRTIVLRPLGSADGPRALFKALNV